MIGGVEVGKVSGGGQSANKFTFRGNPVNLCYLMWNIINFYLLIFNQSNQSNRTWIYNRVISTSIFSASKLIPFAIAYNWNWRFISKCFNIVDCK